MKYILAVCLLVIFLVTGFYKRFPEKEKPLITDDTNQFNDSLLVETVTDSMELQYTKLGVNKPHGRGWIEAYSDQIIFNYEPKWEKSKYDR